MMVIWFQVGKIWVEYGTFYYMVEVLKYELLLQIPIAFTEKIFHQIFSDYFENGAQNGSLRNMVRV